MAPVETGRCFVGVNSHPIFGNDLMKFTYCSCNSHVHAYRLSFLPCDIVPARSFRFEFRHYFNLIFPSLEIQLWDDETSEILGNELSPTSSSYRSFL